MNAYTRLNRGRYFIWQRRTRPAPAITEPCDRRQAQLPSSLLVVLLSMRHQALNEQDRQSALVKKEQRYRMLVESAPIPIASSVLIAIVFANPAGAALVGARQSDEVAGKALSDLVHPDDRALSYRARA